MTFIKIDFGPAPQPQLEALGLKLPLGKRHFQPA